MCYQEAINLEDIDIDSIEFDTKSDLFKYLFYEMGIMGKIRL